MNPICFYHNADLDGVCSGAIVKKFAPDCELYGIDYADVFPWDRVDPNLSGMVPDLQCDRRTVYMVDFSLPFKDMKRLAAVSKLVWIDHHKSAIEELCVPDGPVFSRYHCLTNKAGCELCWEYFMGPAGSVPEAVRLLGRYDVWDKCNPDWLSKILPFQYGCRAEDGIYDPAGFRWGRLFHDVPNEVSAVIEVGRAILKFQAEQNRRACEQGARDIYIAYERWFTAAGVPCAFETGCPNGMYGERQMLRAIACNTTTFNSQFFDGFYDPEKHDVMCAYMQLKDGRWKVSLYSTKPEIDCGAVCKTFGGGGHRGAAGFIMETLPWGAQ